jgi:putative phosphoesterase
MRIGIISDVHGNLLALDAVLQELEHQGVDRIVCLGDTAALGPQPRDVLARLRDLECDVILGNTDAWLLDPKPHAIRDDYSRRVAEVEQWCADQLLPKDLEFVRSFRSMILVSLGAGSEMLCYHGSPRSDSDRVLAVTPADELVRMLDGVSAPIMAGGHTHEQMLRPYRETLLVNPGSVGLPYRQPVPPAQAYRPPWAEYAVVDWQESRRLVEFGRVRFQISRLSEIAKESGMPHVEWWIGAWEGGASE